MQTTEAWLSMLWADKRAHMPRLCVHVMIDLCVFGGVSNVWPFFLKQFHTFYADSYASLTVSPCCAEVLQGKEWANVSLPLPSPVPRFGLPLLGLGIELGPHAM